MIGSIVGIPRHNEIIGGMNVKVFKNDDCDDGNHSCIAKSFFLYTNKYPT